MYIPKEPEMVKMINPRGRIVTVKPKEVSNLLAKGFMKAPEQEHGYNPVFDKTETINAPYSQLQGSHYQFRKELPGERI